MIDDVRLRIQEAAKLLFAKHGYDATSVRQICEEAGVNVALVSYYFGGKEKLLFSLLEQFFAVEERFARIDAVPDPVERLKTFIREFMEHMDENPETARLVHHELFLHSERMEEVRAFVIPVWSRVQDMLREGREQGKFDFQFLDQSLMHVTGTLLFPIHNRAVCPILKDPPLEFEQSIAERTRYILRGLGVKPIE